MIIHINTTKNRILEIILKKGDAILAKKEVKSDFDQGEKILPAIDKLLKSKKIGLEEITGIEVANKGGSFTSLRIGVVTANALGYALGAPVKGECGEGKHESGFDIVEPFYDKEPNIGRRVTHSI
ncbi:MAG: hypothetical protein AAB906_04145 [Patescibacteria group bacterium]